MPSPYFSRLRTVVQRSIVGDDGAVQDLVRVFIRKEKLLFGNSWMLHSRSFSSLSELQALLRPGTVVPASLDSQVVNQRKNLSVVGAISRTFSIPSVSGPSFQACGYHIDIALSDLNQVSISSKLQNKPMAASGSRVVFGEHYRTKLTSRHEHRLPDSASIIYNSRIRSFDSCQKATMSLKNREQPNNSAIYGYFIYEAGKRLFSSFPVLGSGSRELHSSSSTCFSAGPAHDVSFDNSSREEQLSGSADSSDQYVPSSCFFLLLSYTHDVFLS